MQESLPRHSDVVRLLFPLIRVLTRLLFAFLGPICVRGAYRVPRRGGVLVLANHRADIDPIVVQVACPRRVHFMAKSELFGIPILGGVIRSFGAFPVRRGAPDRASLRVAIELLRAGKVVGVFPEGELTESGDLQPILPGAALVARQAGVPVICVGLRNTERVLPYGKLIPRPGWRRIWAVWGEPRSFSTGDSNAAVVEWVEAQLRSLCEDD